MKYYATVKHHSIVGHWEEIKANNLTGAKRKATAEFGDGYNDHVIHLVECTDDTPLGLLNDLPAYTKRIGGGGWVNP